MEIVRANQGSGGRRIWLVTLLTVLVGAVAIVGCGGDDDGGSKSDNSAATSDTTTGFTVALLSPGTKNDASWGQAVGEGATEACEKYDCELTVAENLAGPAQYQQQANAFAAEGTDLIIIADGSVAQVTEKTAKQNPDLKFGHLAAAFDPVPKNAATSNPEFQIGTFLAGAEAGMLTETDTLGLIGAFDFPLLTVEMEGFALGARYTNADVSVARSYIESWTDVGKAKAAAEAQASKGADIIFSATNQATQGIYQVAQSGGTLKYVIPQYLDLTDQAPSVILTSVLYNLQGATARFIEMYAKDEWVNENVDLGLDFGTGKLAPNPALQDQVPDDVQARVDELTEQIRSGEIKLPGYEVLGQSGSGDKIDLDSLGGTPGGA